MNKLSPRVESERELVQGGSKPGLLTHNHMWTWNHTPMPWFPISYLILQHIMKWNCRLQMQKFIHWTEKRTFWPLNADGFPIWSTFNVGRKWKASRMLRILLTSASLPVKKIERGILHSFQRVFTFVWLLLLTKAWVCNRLYVQVLRSIYTYSISSFSAMLTVWLLVMSVCQLVSLPL